LLSTLQIQNVDAYRLAPKSTLGPVSHFTLFLVLISIENIIYSAAPHQKSQKNEEISESKIEPPCQTARRGSGSNTGRNWKQHFGFQYPDQINQEKEVPNQYIPQSISILFIYLSRFIHH